MSTSKITRKLPNSNISRQKASNTMVKKNDSIVAPAKSALTPDTIERLNTDDTNYNTAITAVTNAKAARTAAKNVAVTKRKLLRDNISGLESSLNNHIKLNSMPVEARAYYGFATGNKKSPPVNTDIKLDFWGKKIIEGDALRVAAGGVAMSGPTIIQFTTIFNSYKSSIVVLSTAKTNVGKASAAVNVLNKEMNSMLLRANNEVETTFSELEAPAKRAAAREWGVRYVSVGSLAIVSGTIIDKTSGLPLEKVKVHFDGGKIFSLTDSLGKYSLNTNLFGDLELIADLTDYIEIIKAVKMENGVNMTIDLEMVAE